MNGMRYARENTCAKQNELYSYTLLAADITDITDSEWVADSRAHKPTNISKAEAGNAI